MNEETKDTRMLPVQCNCAWNPDRHADTCPVNLRDRLTDAQARLAKKDARIAQLAAHARGKNKALANALKEIERFDADFKRLGEQYVQALHQITTLRAQLEKLQAAPAERGVVPTAWQLKGWNHCIETAAEAIAYLLKNGRPAAYGNSRYNEEHCRDIINSLSVELRERKEFFARLNPSPATADSDVREVKP